MAFRQLHVASGGVRQLGTCRHWFMHISPGLETAIHYTERSQLPSAAHFLQPVSDSVQLPGRACW
eukprot:11486672-Alexandrium_andersonii.AAC.1